MPNTEFLVAAVRRAREALNQRTAKEVSIATSLEMFKDESQGALQADKILTETLNLYPLHPYLLVWRANARFRIAYAALRQTSDTIELRPATAAIEDLTTASEVAPDYLEPRIDLAFHLLNYADQPHAAAELFELLVTELQKRLCDCAAGLVESLAKDPELARKELARWQSAFPDSERLHEASAWLDLIE